MENKGKPLIVWMSISVFLLMIASNMPVIISELNSDMEDYESRIGASYEIIKDTLSEGVVGFAIETSNTELIKRAVNGVIQQDFITEIRITDKDKNPIYSVSNPKYSGIDLGTTLSTTTPIYSFNSVDAGSLNTNLVADSAVVEKSDIVGYVYINTTKSAYQSEQLARLWKYIIMSLAASLLFIIVFFFGIRKFTKSMGTLLGSANRLAKGEKGVVLSENYIIRELSEFSSAFNKISIKLDAERTRLEEEENENEVKNNILQIAAHDIRTPIAHIKSRLDIALSTSNDDKTDKQMNQCLESINELDRHIISVLNLTAIDQGTLATQNGWINANTLIEKIAEPFQSKAMEKPSVGLFINTAISLIENDVFIDFDLISIVVNNAIENAFKYTDQGSIKVVSKIDIVESTLSIKVIDTGEGLTDDQLAVLRSSPKKLEANTIKRSRDGWGVGMRTMQQFTEHLNGTFNIDSTEDYGTKVSFLFPVKLRENTTQSEQNKKFNQAHNSIIFTNKVGADNPVNVLVIDNDIKDIEIMEEQFSPAILRRDDVQVTFTTDSSLALQQMENHYFDLIFIDYHMEKDGLYVLRFIDEHETKCKQSKKYILTADSNIEPEVKDEMLRLGDGIVSKGASIQQLKDLLRRATLKCV